jgi:glycerol-3-phosphate acyltransferase PlsY
MKKFISGSYLDFLFAFTVIGLLFSVFFTFVAGESPMQALGVDPAIATLSSGAMLLVLIIIPALMRKLKNPAS